ncbi:class I SAM-dependent methyltransferase [Geodermatophilus sp. SYSU D00758]
MDITSAIRVDPSNAEQFRAWNGGEGTFWAEHADRLDRAVARYDERLLTAAVRGGADVVLDIGCGTGRITREAARRAPAGSALGVDLSGPMLEIARRSAQEEGLTTVRFEQADAQVHPFPAAAFDVALSRTGATFFADPVAAFGNIGRAVAPGGRLALLVWQAPAANEWFAEITAAFAAGRPLPVPPPGAPGPFAFAAPDRARAVLTAAGFTDVELEPAAEPMWFGSDPDDATAFVRGVAGWMLEGLDAAGRARAVEVLHRSAAAHVTAAGVEFGSATWLVTARRPAP